MIEEIKTVKLSSKRQISIPTSFTSLKEGDKAVMRVESNKIVIEPLKDFDSEAFDTMLMSERVLAEDWLSEEDEKAYAHLQKYLKDE